MNIAVGGDMAGFPMKGPVIEMLKNWEHQVTDCGIYEPGPADFPDLAQKVCDEVRSRRADRGVMVCGTGVGASIAANKVPGIRAGLCHDVHCAHQSVEHDDANVLCMGGWIIGIKTAEEVLKAFLDAKYDATPDFVRRLKKLEDMERRAARELLK